MAQSSRSPAGRAPSPVAPSPVAPSPVAPSTGGNQSRMESTGLARRAPESTPANDFTENIGDGELDACSDVEGHDAHSTARMASLRRGVQAALQPWAQQRATANLHFDVTALNSLISGFVREWDEQQGRSSTEEAVRSALDVGTIRASLAEIAAFEMNLYWAYIEFLDITAADMPTHQYTLEPRGSASAGELAGASGTAATLRYRNDHGMGWSVDGVIATAGMRVAVGAEAHGEEDETGGNFGAVEFSLGEDPIEAAPTRTYFSPEDFAWATVLDMEAEAGVEMSASGEGFGASEGRGSAVRFLVIEGGEHTLEFRVLENNQPTDGTEIDPDAEDFEVNAGAEATLRSEGGLAIPTGGAVAESNVAPLAEAADRPDPVMQVQTVLHFATGDARLDADDLVSLQDLVEQMYAGTRRFHGALYEIELVGFASRQWRAARNADDALQHNRDLASRRVATARRNLTALLEGGNADFNERIENEFDQGVRDDFANVRALSPVSSSSDVQGEGEGPENDPEYRAVEIMVTWHPCRGSERVDSMRI